MGCGFDDIFVGKCGGALREVRQLARAVLSQSSHSTKRAGLVTDAGILEEIDYFTRSGGRNFSLRAGPTLLPNGIGRACSSLRSGQIEEHECCGLGGAQLERPLFAHRRAVSLSERDAI